MLWIFPMCCLLFSIAYITIFMSTISHLHAFSGTIVCPLVRILFLSLFLPLSPLLPSFPPSSLPFFLFKHLETKTWCVLIILAPPGLLLPFPLLLCAQGDCPLYRLNSLELWMVLASERHGQETAGWKEIECRFFLLLSALPGAGNAEFLHG